MTARELYILIIIGQTVNGELLYNSDLDGSTSPCVVGNPRLKRGQDTSCVPHVLALLFNLNPSAQQLFWGMPSVVLGQLQKSQ